MEENTNYEMLIRDMYKIYLYCIDSNNVKKFQTINNKYTTTDKAMLSIYIFLQLIEKENINKEEAKKYIGNVLIKNLVNCSTGNFEVDIRDNSHIKIYNEVKNVVSEEKIQYLNRTLEKLKINMEEIINEQIEELFSVCEKLAEIFILLQIYLTGNEFAYDFIIRKLNELKLNKNNYEDIIILFDEVVKVLDNKRKVIEILKVNDIYKLVSVVFNLRDVNRFSQVHLIIPENVLFHTYINAVMLYVMSDYLNENGEKVDKYELIIKALFHDFSEYSGNEIISYMKVYSKETHDLFEQIEKADEASLKELIGENDFEIVKQYKEGFLGYIADIIDKINGISKVLIELEYYNNLSMLKLFVATECKRFEKFYNYDRIESSKNKYFYTNLLKLHYIYIIERFMNNKEIMNMYFNSQEIEDIRKSIEEEKKNLIL